jgi:serine protease Do
MNETVTLRSTARSLLSGRRLALMAGVAGLGAAAIVGPDLSLRATVPTFTSGAHAQAVMRPASFADIVEKVKPAVFAVRVKVENAASMMNFEGETPFGQGDNSPMERFFKRFGFGDLPE